MTFGIVRIRDNTGGSQLTAWDIAFYVVLFIGFLGFLSEAWETVNPRGSLEAASDSAIIASIEGSRDRSKQDYLINLRNGWLAFIATDIYIWAFRFWRRGLVTLGLPQWTSWLLGITGLAVIIVLTWVSLTGGFKRFWAWFPIFLIAGAAAFGYLWAASVIGDAYFGHG
ncbi:MAG: hypothetical protein M3460_22990 [Actinomycetota bacterium]|nr:hypothetical protein [Actinomycetota bacterium]